MGKNINDSIEKLDEQIEKLTLNNYDLDNTPKITKKELSRKVKLAKIDEEIEKNKKIVKTTSSVTTKTIKLDRIKDEINKTKARPVKKSNTVVKKSNGNQKSLKLSDKVVNKIDDVKEKYKIDDKKELINEVLDNQTEVDKILNLLTKMFTILIVLFVVLFLIVCFI